MNILNEEWRDVSGYEDYYQVSSLGRLRSCDRVIFDGRWGDRFRKGALMKPALNARGYIFAVLCKHGKCSTLAIHSLVARAFLGDRPDRCEVNHIDGNRLNNSASNCEYVTPSQNMLHAYAKGLVKPKRGELNGCSILTDTKVLEIRELAFQGLKDSEIAPLFGISRVTVYDVRIRRTWKHI